MVASGSCPGLSLEKGVACGEGLGRHWPWPALTACNTVRGGFSVYHCGELVISYLWSREERANPEDLCHRFPRPLARSLVCQKNGQNSGKL